MSHRQTPPDWDAYPIEDGSDGQLFLPLCTTPERLQRILQALHAFYPDNIHDQEHLIDIITALKYQDDPLSAPCVQSIFLGEFMTNLDTELSDDGLSFRFMNSLTGDPVGDWIPLPVIQQKFVAGPSQPAGTQPKVTDLGFDGDGVRTWEISPVTGDPGAQGEQGIPGVPGQDGTTIDDVTITALSYDQSPTASLNGSTLELGIPQQPPLQMRVADGYLQYRIAEHDLVPWVDLIALVDLQGDGIKDVLLKMLDPESTPYAYLVDEVLELGIPRARDGQDGQDGTGGYFNPVDDETNETLAHICAGVGYALDYARDLYLDSLDEVAYVISGTKIIGDVSIAVLELASGGFLGWFPLGEAWGYVANSSQLRVDKLRDLVTDTIVYESWKHALYCAIVANNNQLTQEVWEDWKSNLATPEVIAFAPLEAYIDFVTNPIALPTEWGINGLMDATMGQFLEVLGWHGFYARYNVGYVNRDFTCSAYMNCVPKDDWCATWNQSDIWAGLPGTSDSGWEILNGEQMPANGGVGSRFDGNNNYVSIALDFKRAALVKKITVTLSGTTGTFNFTGWLSDPFEHGIWLHDAATVTGSSLQQVGPITSPIEAHFSHIADRVVIIFYAGTNNDVGQPDPGGQLVIESIEMCGTGDHPLAWCHTFNYQEVAGDAYPVTTPTGTDTAAYLPGVGWVAQPGAVEVVRDDGLPPEAADGIVLMQPLPVFDLVSVRLLAEFDAGDPRESGNNVVSLELDDGTRLDDSTPASETPAGGFTSHQTFNPAETNPAFVRASLLSQDTPGVFDGREVTIRSITVCGLGYNPFTAPSTWTYTFDVNTGFAGWTFENNKGAIVNGVPTAIKDTDGYYRLFIQYEGLPNVMTHRIEFQGQWTVNQGVIQITGTPSAYTRNITPSAGPYVADENPGFAMTQYRFVSVSNKTGPAHTIESITIQGEGPNPFE